MTLFDFPIWQHLASYAHIDRGRGNLDILQLPDNLRTLALGAVCPCVACGAPIHPLRARMKSERARVAGTETERRLFYAPTCPTELNPGCSRTKAAKTHKQTMLARLLSADVGTSLKKGQSQ